MLKNIVKHFLGNIDSFWFWRLRFRIARKYQRHVSFENYNLAQGNMTYFNVCRIKLLNINIQAWSLFVHRYFIDLLKIASWWDCVIKDIIYTFFVFYLQNKSLSCWVQITYNNTKEIYLLNARSKLIPCEVKSMLYVRHGKC